jgi:hypothetical protein
MPISSEKLQDRARDTALALPGVSHRRSCTEQLDACKVAGKVFLIVTDDPDERIVTLKAEPEYGRLPQHEHPSIALVGTLPDRPITLAPWPRILKRAGSTSVCNSGPHHLSACLIRAEHQPQCWSTPAARRCPPPRSWSTATAESTSVRGRAHRDRQVLDFIGLNSPIVWQNA